MTARERVSTLVWVTMTRDEGEKRRRERYAREREDESVKEKMSANF